MIPPIENNQDDLDGIFGPIDKEEDMFKGYCLIWPTQPMTWPTGERMVFIGHKKAFIKYLEGTGRLDKVDAMSGPERDKEYLKWLDANPQSPLYTWTGDYPEVKRPTSGDF